eukprot:Lankesteria_metandrocarpae@DN5259_c0_g1_i1.p1
MYERNTGNSLPFSIMSDISRQGLDGNVNDNSKISLRDRGVCTERALNTFQHALAHAVLMRNITEKWFELLYELSFVFGCNPWHSWNGCLSSTSTTETLKI